MRIFRLFTALAVMLGLSACAHNISISPNSENLASNKPASKIDKNIAYFISSDLRAKQVTTPGGGGDKVSYQPYRDVEAGLYIVLSNVFSNVQKLDNVNDNASLVKNSINLILTPTLVTNSSSPSPFTWPPTKFETILTCQIKDSGGKVIFETKVVGNGAAEFSEFKRDFSLSARRSTEDALKKLQDALLNAPELRGASINIASINTSPLNETPSISPSVSKQATIAASAPAAPVAAPVAVAAAPAKNVAPEPAAVKPINNSSNNTTIVAPASEQETKTESTVAKNAAKAVDKSSPTANTKPTEKSNIQLVDFVLGTSSITVERLAKERSCEDGRGAGLVSPKGSRELYKMQCADGRVLMAKCELRQCSVLSIK